VIIRHKHGDKKTVFKDAMHRLQKGELFYKKNQGNGRKKIRNAKTLQSL